MTAEVDAGSVVTWAADAGDPPVGLVIGRLPDSGRLVVAMCSWGEATRDVLIDPAEFSERQENGEPALAVSVQDTVTLAASDVTAVARVHGDALSRVLRERTKGNARWFHDAYHLPRHPHGSSTVAYAGRIFDHHEVELAVDASLDFWLTMGRFSDRLQRDLAHYLGIRRTLLVGSGSSANLLALTALTSRLLGSRALEPGDEVITTACGFPTTLNPILQNDCVAVLVDTNPATGNIDLDGLEAALSSRSKAVMLAHALGNPFNLDRVREFCRRNNLWLIEDACDALGSTYDGVPVGSFGDLSTLSFYPAHHMTTGEGGAVNVVRDPLLQRIVESFRDWGRDCWCKSGQDNVCGKRFSYPLGELPPGYDHKFAFSHVGYNLKPTDWQAAIGCAQFEKLADFNRLRRSNWALLREVFAAYEDIFELPSPEPKSDPSWFGFKVLLRPDAPFERNALAGFFEAERVQTRMVFGGNLARQPAYLGRLRENGNPALRWAGELTGADRLMNSAFFLGVYPGLTESHIERVSEVLAQFLKEHGAAARSDDELRLAARDLSPRREAVRGKRAEELRRPGH
jgi:CDP-4-dehydro-6-deoxyglucose reductase, E1